MAAVPRHVVPDGEALLPLPCPVCCCYQAAVCDAVALLPLVYHCIVHLQICNIGQIAVNASVVLLLLVCQVNVLLQVYNSPWACHVRWSCAPSACRLMLTAAGHTK